MPCLARLVLEKNHVFLGLNLLPGVCVPEVKTLNDVATIANVSPSTVSRILNGSAVVAKDKRERVLKAIEQLNYRPNVIAQGLARGQSMTIGVITQAISSPFYGEALAGVEQGLEGSGYHALFASGHWLIHEEREALKMLTSRRVDAIILTGSSIPDLELQQLSKTLPVVIVGRTVPGLEDQCISVNNTVSGSLGIQYLISLGHRQIAYVSGTATIQGDAVERLEAYCQALEAAGIKYDPNLVIEGDYQERSGLFAIETLFARGAIFTAVACANDQSAYGVRLALYRRGIRVPDDVSLIGFDDLQASAYTTPPLTTVRQPVVEMGRLASQMALSMLKGAPMKSSQIKAELVIRESTAVLRGTRA
jgi:LacI family transcriptional regulator